MRKIYIIDTSVLIYDPNSHQSFVGNDVIIPICVLDELDKLKNLPNDTGRNARVFIRNLDKLCQNKDIHQGIPLPGDIVLKIDTNTVAAENFGSAAYTDNKILACAKNVLNQVTRTGESPCQIVLVSKDINLRIRARAFHIKSEDYEKDKTPVADLYQGFTEIIDGRLGTLLKEQEYLSCKGEECLENLLPNECVHFVDQAHNGLSIGRKIQDKIKFIANRHPWELDLKNKEQAFAVDLLSDPRVPLVTLVGRSGTGKTLIAMATGLEMVLSKKSFNRLIVYRPIQPVGNDIGYLPGTLEEKLDPWMHSIKDSLDFLTGKSRKGGTWKDRLSPQYVEKIEMQALTYVRGRSIPNAFILVDEAQNMSKEEVKTILTRVSSGTKVVLTGDIEQIDNSFLDATNNGLSYVIEKFKDSDLAGHITFTRGERSALASKAAEIL